MSKTSQALQEIKNMPKEYNHLKKAGKGLSVNAIEMIKLLKSYEFKFPKYAREGIEDDWELIEYLTENGKGKRWNSYNWNSDVVFELAEFDFRGRKYIAIAYHLYGDVRGNYTDFIFYDIDGIENLSEILWELVKTMSFVKRYYEIKVESGDLLGEGGKVNIYWKSRLKGDGEGEIDDVYVGDLEDTKQIKEIAFDEVRKDILHNSIRG